MVAEGGLISYGPNYTDAFRQVGDIVGRVLKGENLKTCRGYRGPCWPRRSRRRAAAYEERSDRTSALHEPSKTCRGEGRTPVCAENLNPSVAVMKSPQKGV